MKKEILKIGFVLCLVLSIVFAVLLISNSILLFSTCFSGFSMVKYLKFTKIDTIFLFVFAIGTIIFKSIEIYDKGKGQK